MHFLIVLICRDYFDFDFGRIEPATTPPTPPFAPPASLLESTMMADKRPRMVDESPRPRRRLPQRHSYSAEKPTPESPFRASESDNWSRRPASATRRPVANRRSFRTRPTTATTKTTTAATDYDYLYEEDGEDFNFFRRDPPHRPKPTLSSPLSHFTVPRRRVFEQMEPVRRKERPSKLDEEPMVPTLHQELKRKLESSTPPRRSAARPRAPAPSPPAPPPSPVYASNRRTLPAMYAKTTADVKRKTMTSLASPFPTSFTSIRSTPLPAETDAPEVDPVSMVLVRERHGGRSSTATMMTSTSAPATETVEAKRERVRHTPATDPSPPLRLEEEEENYDYPPNVLSRPHPTNPDYEYVYYYDEDDYDRYDDYDDYYGMVDVKSAKKPSKIRPNSLERMDGKNGTNGFRPPLRKNDMLPFVGNGKDFTPRPPVTATSVHTTSSIGSRESSRPMSTLTTTTTTTTTTTVATTTTSTTTTARTAERSRAQRRPYSYKPPQDYGEEPCPRGIFCDASDGNYPL